MDPQEQDGNPAREVDGINILQTSDDHLMDEGDSGMVPPRLRSWMPSPPKGSGRILNTYLFIVLITILFTVLIVVASEQLSDEYSWLRVLLQLLISAVFGWSLALFWDSVHLEEKQQELGKNLDNQAEDFILGFDDDRNRKRPHEFTKLPVFL